MVRVEARGVAKIVRAKIMEVLQYQNGADHICNSCLYGGIMLWISTSIMMMMLKEGTCGYIGGEGGFFECERFFGARGVLMILRMYICI